MDIPHIVRKLELGTGAADIEAKASELLRRATQRFGVSGPGRGGIAKPAVCVELACGLAGTTVPQARFVSMSGVQRKVYMSVLSQLQNILAVRTEHSLRQLGVKLGGVRIALFAEKVFAAYRARFVAALPAVRRAGCDDKYFSSPVFNAAAFFLCAAKEKLKVDKAKLLQLTRVPPNEFASVCASMLDTCFDMIGTGKRKPSAARGHSAQGPALGSQQRQSAARQPHARGSAAFMAATAATAVGGSGDGARAAKRQRKHVPGAGAVLGETNKPVACHTALVPCPDVPLPAGQIRSAAGISAQGGTGTNMGTGYGALPKRQLLADAALSRKRAAADAGATAGASSVASGTVGGEPAKVPETRMPQHQSGAGSKRGAKQPKAATMRVETNDVYRLWKEKVLKKNARKLKAAADVDTSTGNPGCSRIGSTVACANGAVGTDENVHNASSVDRKLNDA